MPSAGSTTELIKALNVSVKSLEREDVTIDEALIAYTDGWRAIRRLEERLSEKSVVEIVDADGNVSPFDVEFEHR